MSTTPASPSTASTPQAADSGSLSVFLREAPQTPAIDPARFTATLDFLAPKSEDMKWATIPWETDLWEARRIAAEQDKPIFAWMMNGNPLGCV